MKKQHGFTLIETLIAIFLLTLTVSALLQLASSGFYSVRYARNQLIGNALLQESLEYVHNSRDSAILSGTGWQPWLATYSTNQNGTSTGDTSQGCFTSNGCIVDAFATTAPIKGCDSTCSAITLFTSVGLYGYSNASYPLFNGQSIGTGSATTYIRTIKMTLNSPDQVTVSTTVSWLNGSARKSVTQSVLLTNWK